MPTFNISIADNYPNSTMIQVPRGIFLDIFTQPGVFYNPMQIQVSTPSVSPLSDPIATVCSLNVYNVGVYTSCVQPSYFNDYLNGKLIYSAE